MIIFCLDNQTLPSWVWSLMTFIPSHLNREVWDFLMQLNFNAINAFYSKCIVAAEYRHIQGRTFPGQFCKAGTKISPSRLIRPCLWNIYKCSCLLTTYSLFSLLPLTEFCIYLFVDTRSKVLPITWNEIDQGILHYCNYVTVIALPRWQPPP